MKAFNIDWDIDIDEIYEAVDNKTVDFMSELLGIDKDRYANMTTEKRHDWVDDAYRHNRLDFEALFDLPYEIEIPDYVGTDEDMITDFIAYEYGFCFRDYDLSTDLKEM